MIVILHSAITEHAALDDQETMQQVAAVAAALEELGLAAITLPFTLDFDLLKAQLRHYDPALVFNLVESINGRSDLCHLVPMWLEELGLPYTGGNPRSIMMSSDKLLAKNILEIAGIAVPRVLTWADKDNLFFPEDGPYIIKSARADGSIGIDQTSIINDYASFAAGIAARQQQFGGEWFAERFIAGREFNIGILATLEGPLILPIAEIEFRDFSQEQFAIVDYAAKWQVESNEYQQTVRCFNNAAADARLFNQLQELALVCWRTFSASGYARLDVRVDQQGKPWVLELNINPSLAPDAGFAAAAAQAGYDYAQIINQVIKSGYL